MPLPLLVSLTFALTTLLGFAVAIAEPHDDAATWIERVPAWDVPHKHVDTMAVRIRAADYLDAAMLYQREPARGLLYLRHAESGTPLLVIAPDGVAIYEAASGRLRVMSAGEPALAFGYEDESLKLRVGTVNDVFGEDVPSDHPRLKADLRSFFTPFADTAAHEVDAKDRVSLRVQTQRGNTSLATFRNLPDGRFDKLQLYTPDRPGPLLEVEFLRHNERLNLTELRLPIDKLRERQVVVDEWANDEQVRQRAAAFVRSWPESFAIVSAMDDPKMRPGVERELERAVDWEQAVRHQRETMPQVKAVLDAWFDHYADGDGGLAAGE